MAATLRQSILRRGPVLLVLLITVCTSSTCRKQQSAALINSTVPLMKFRLQVGIDDYDYVNKLNGCAQDVFDMKEVLIERFEFPVDNILTLTNKQATHDAIIEAFKTHLIENAKKHPGAFVIFQYSGHDSQVDDCNGDESDNLDETIVPVDSRDPENKHFDIIEV